MAYIMWVVALESCEINIVQAIIIIMHFEPLYILEDSSC